MNLFHRAIHDRVGDMPFYYALLNPMGKPYIVRPTEQDERDASSDAGYGYSLAIANSILMSPNAWTLVPPLATNTYVFRWGFVSKSLIDQCGADGQLVFSIMRPRLAWRVVTLDLPDVVLKTDIRTGISSYQTRAIRTSLPLPRQFNHDVFYVDLGSVYYMEYWRNAIFCFFVGSRIDSYGLWSHMGYASSYFPFVSNSQPHNLRDHEMSTGFTLVRYGRAFSPWWDYLAFGHVPKFDASFSDTARELLKFYCMYELDMRSRLFNSSRARFTYLDIDAALAESLRARIVHDTPTEISCDVVVQYPWWLS